MSLSLRELMGGPFAKEDIVEEMEERRERAHHCRVSGLLEPPSGADGPQRRLCEVLLALSPVGRRSVGALGRGKFMQTTARPFRSKQGVVIHAPIETVWAFNMDLSKIAEYHPRVCKVALISGTASREAGVSYQCHLKGGKHTCVEKDIELIPMHKIVTILPEDTLGISKALPDYVVETTFAKLGPHKTKMEISHYYSTKTLRARLWHLLGQRKIARETQETLNAIKHRIESEGG